jgi:uncharacterized membrane protein YjgN (DUF898 family)
MHRALAKMAKIFRLEEDQRMPIMEQLEQGTPWHFNFKLSDDQARTAATYLRSLGFDVDLNEYNQAEEERLKAEEQDLSKLTTVSSGGGLPMEFNGKGGEFFVLFLTNALKTVFTLGIYHFWAKTKVRNYLWGKTSFAKDAFSYHGTGAELFKGFLIFGLLIAVILGLVGVVEVYTEVDENLLGSVLALGFYMLLPILIVGAWRYRLSRTSWRGIRFSFRGKRLAAFSLYFKGYLLIILTLGFYWPYFKNNTEAFWRGNSYFGDKNFTYTGQGKDIFGRSVGALILSVLTLGVYWFWFNAYLQRYFWSHTQMAGGTFKFTATGGQWFGLWFTNLLLLIVSLGLAFPWIVLRTRKFIADHLTLEGYVNLDKVVQDMKVSGALGEEALDAFDVPIDIG